MLSRFRQSFLVRGVAYVLGVIWCIGALAGAVAPWCLNVSIPWQNGYSRIDIRSSRGVCGISLQHVDAVASAQIQKVQGPRTRVFFPSRVYPAHCSFGKLATPDASAVVAMDWRGHVWGFCERSTHPGANALCWHRDRHLTSVGDRGDYCLAFHLLAATVGRRRSCVWRMNWHRGLDSSRHHSVQNRSNQVRSPAGSIMRRSSALEQRQPSYNPCRKQSPNSCLGER